MIDDDFMILDEYDFSTGVRGQYAARCAEGSNVVVLDPGMAGVFRTRRRDHPRHSPAEAS